MFLQKAQSVLHAMQQTDGGVNHVLHVMVDNMVYQVTVDTLHKIFLRFGSVLKIITFIKNSKCVFFLQSSCSRHVGMRKGNLKRIDDVTVVQRRPTSRSSSLNR